MRRADNIVDMGPGAGIHGGRIMAQGTFEELAAMPDSVTGAALHLSLIHISRDSGPGG